MNVTASWTRAAPRAASAVRDAALLQLVDALRQRGIKVVLVTHLFDAARQLQGQGADHVPMLRAEPRRWQPQLRAG